ncbi:MAG: hypothetical protein K6T55_05730 [Syntrophobacterales bacterium]|nr:hypothetical protein [Syntrophobacterales bacterium]
MRLDWRYKLSLALVAASLAIYGVNYLIFRDWGYMMRLFFGQLGFLPLSIIVVTLVINQLLATRAQQARLHKMNIVIGAFFSEVGVALLKRCLRFDAQREELQEAIGALSRWSPADFRQAAQVLARHPYAVDCGRGDLAELKQFLLSKRDFLLRLLENPTLLEHEAFTNLLWAVCHLGEELGYRREVTQLAPADREHLSGDLKRAYQLLAAQWLTYLEYLQRAYPYLFSLAARINPLHPRAQAEIALPGPGA